MGGVKGNRLECAAIQDVLVVGKALEEDESQNRKTELDRRRTANEGSPRNEKSGVGPSKLA